MPSNAKTIKYHKLGHACELMVRMGNMKHYDSNFYESDHRITKGLHKMTSMRANTFMKEMVRHDYKFTRTHIHMCNNALNQILQ